MIKENSGPLAKARCESEAVNHLSKQCTDIFGLRNEKALEDLSRKGG